MDFILPKSLVARFCLFHVGDFAAFGWRVGVRQQPVQMADVGIEQGGIAVVFDSLEDVEGSLKARLGLGARVEYGRVAQRAAGAVQVERADLVQRVSQTQEDAVCLAVF